MGAKYQTDTCVLPSNVCFSFPQLDVRVPQFQNPSTVDATTQRIILANSTQNLSREVLINLFVDHPVSAIIMLVVVGIQCLTYWHLAAVAQ